MTIPAVSVVIPLYNKKDYISRTIDSVLNQTWSDYEIIVINDGSTDGSEKIVSSYNNPKIKLYSQKNQGVSTARNNGISKADGELIAFLDADDEWRPNFLENIIQLNKKYPNAGIYSTAYSIINSQTKVTEQIVRCSDVPDGFNGLLKSYFHAVSTGPHPLTTSGVVIPNTILKHDKRINEKFNEKMRIGEDLDLWARIALFYPAAYSSEPSYTYYMNTANNHHKTSPGTIINPAESFINYLQKQETNKSEYYESEYNISLYISYLHVLHAQELSDFGRRKDALKELKSAKHKEILTKKIGCLIYITFPDIIFKMILKLSRRFTKIGQTLQ